MVDVHDAPTAAALADADDLVARGRPVEAIRLLTEANRRHRDPVVEARLVDLRHRAFDAIGRRPARRPNPSPRHRDPSARSAHDRRRPRLATVREMASQGCVLVRGLIPPERAEQLARGIDRALAGFDADEPGPAGATGSWYVPFTPIPGRHQVVGRRNWVRASGGLWTVDSPRMLFELTEIVEQTGIGRLVTDYLGERPALSANKCTLRRVPVDTATNWHQDGAFLGAEVRTLNLWLALTPSTPTPPG